MAALQQTKPVGGIASVALLPAWRSAGGSPEAIAAEAVEVPLIEGLSTYDEKVEARDGVLRVEHRLTIAVEPEYARSELDGQTRRLWVGAGVAAVVVTMAGERLVVGWSERFGLGQPLRLAAIETSTGKSPHTTPATVVTLRSVDTSTAVRISS